MLFEVLLSVRFKTLPPSTLSRVRRVGFRKGKKKGSDQLPNPTLPPAPLPPMPGMPLPPPGGAPLPAPIAPESATVPDLPVPSPEVPVLESSEPNNESSEEGYNQLWAKKSDKPLPQIYGHIDRISSGEVGSLLDRYADRFGHSLDRDIIVLRKQEHDDKLAQIRDAPIVELVEDEVVELSLEEKLKSVESEIRALKPSYQEAKASGDSEKLSEIRPQLESLLSERKSLKSQLDESLPESVTEEVEESTIAEESTDGEDIFIQFVAIVDELLGSHLPEEVVEDFVSSEDFSVYQAVGSDPSTADDDLRGQFFAIVDSQLANMSEESIETFVASSDFEIYRTVGEMY